MKHGVKLFLFKFLINFTVCKAVKPQKHKGLFPVQELGTKILITSGNGKRVIRRIVDRD